MIFYLLTDNVSSLYAFSYSSFFVPVLDNPFLFMSEMVIGLQQPHRYKNGTGPYPFHYGTSLYPIHYGVLLLTPFTGLVEENQYISHAHPLNTTQRTHNLLSCFCKKILQFINLLKNGRFLFFSNMSDISFCLFYFKISFY